MASEAAFQQTVRLQTLNEISRVVSATLDLQTLYETIYEQVGRVMDTAQFFIALHRQDRNVIEIPYLREHGKPSRGLEMAFKDSVTARIIQNGTSLLYQTASDFAVYARANGLPELIVGDEDSESGIFVPLNTGSRTIGAMTVQSSRVHAYTNDDVQTLTVIASQAAVAIENARLYKGSQDAVRQMQALLRVAEMINGSLDLGTVLDAILSGMRDVLPFALAAVLLPEHTTGRLHVVGVSGHEHVAELELRSVQPGEGVTGVVFQTGESLIVPDVNKHQGYVSVLPSIQSEMAIPLKRGDTVAGVLDVQREELDAFSTDDLVLLSLFASQAAIAIENARLFSDEQDRVHELGAIQAIVSQLTPLHDLGSIARLINSELKGLIDFHTCRLFVVEDEGNVLVSISGADFDPVGLRLPVGQGIAGSIAAHGCSELIPDTLLDPRATQVPGTPRRAESMIGAPLLMEGSVRGVITLSKLGINQFDRNALRLLEIIAAQTALAFDRARLYDELRMEAVTDELTGLYNRRYLIARLREEEARAGRTGNTLAAIMLDLDKFKRINDSFGHDAGDMVLREIARVVRKVVRAEDIVARYGGEEYCILLPEISTADAEHVAERLRSAIEDETFPYADHQIRMTVSLGLAYLSDDDELLSLFTRADAAMYQVKYRGGNAVCVATTQGYMHLTG